jgi:hypothetical protein
VDAAISGLYYFIAIALLHQIQLSPLSQFYTKTISARSDHHVKARKSTKPAANQGRTLTLASRSGRGSANARLSLISRHFDQRLPLPELHTPFSSERQSLEPDDVEYKPIDRPLPAIAEPDLSTQQRSIMSSQAAHNTLLIPGPIEFDDAVLQSMSHYA